VSVKETTYTQKLAKTYKKGLSKVGGGDEGKGRGCGGRQSTQSYRGAGALAKKIESREGP